MASKRVKPASSSGTGHTDSGGYTEGPFGPPFGTSGSFDVSPQFNVRRSSSQPKPPPSSKGSYFDLWKSGGSK
jgi:hypothetical protein